MSLSQTCWRCARLHVNNHLLVNIACSFDSSKVSVSNERLMVKKRNFHKSFNQQSAIPDVAIEAAVSLLKSGRLHRYNVASGELSEVAKLEKDYAEYQGSKYCLALASGGQAMQISMRAAGIVHGDAVLTNAFTLAPVPGAISAVGGRPVLIETTENLRLNFEHLERMAKNSGAKYFMLSHMRGHISDMHAIVEICQKHGITLIEDCAHTMGATFDNVKSGNFGIAGCYSTQTYKHINSGEGGLLTSDDPDFMARAIILSGSYMLYEMHGAAPDASAFETCKIDMPNLSARMDSLRAAILRPQLKDIANNIVAWNARYEVLATYLSETCDNLVLPARHPKTRFVPSSIQFLIPGIKAEQAEALIVKLAERGIVIKWFGRNHPKRFTSSHRDWGYIEKQSLPKTDAVLAQLFDMRLPLTFTLDDCRVLGEILQQEISDLKET